MRRLLALTLTLLLAHNASAAISYSTAESVYAENFNALPTGTNPHNGIAIQYNASAHIQNGNAPWTGGWKDDYTTDSTYLGLPGWYVWSDVSTLNTTNGGASAHAQFRYGGGGSPTGTGGNDTGGTGFFLFSQITCLTCGEKALGIRSASAFTNSSAGRRSYVGLQLINDTAETLHSFTITYDGEQYSEGGGTSRDGFDLQWSLAATAAGWMSSNAATPAAGDFYNGTSGVDYGGVAAADPGGFLSPINNNPTNAIATNDINSTDGCFNCVVDISKTVSGINWAPGSQLWIRWRDGDATDGIAVDNIRFTASAAAVGPLVGDYNNDHVVDAADYVTWRKALAGVGTILNETASPNSVDSLDYDAWRGNFGASSSPGLGASTNVPEPAGIVLLFVGVVGLVGVSRRTR